MSLVLLLLIQYFWDKQKKEIEQAGTLVVTSVSDSYAVPAKIWLVFENHSTGAIVLSPCRDITLLRNGTSVQFTQICQDVTLEVWSTHTVDFDKEYAQFLEKGSYVFEIQKDEKKYIIPISVDYRGSLSKLFIALFYQPIYNLMIVLIELFSNSLWWSIIAITILIRLLLVRPQHLMMVSQRKLQAIQPKIKELQDTHKGDAQKLWMELLELYKREKVNPMGSCGLLIIQLPVLLVIYNVIMSIGDTSNSYYLYQFLSAFKVSDIQTNFFGIDMYSVGGITGAVLWVIVWIVQYIQVKLSLDMNALTNTKKWLVLEKKPWDAWYNSLMPDPEFMNKFMLYGMPAMVVVFTYSLFVWVGIYWWVSTIFSIFQQLFVNKIVKK